MGVRPGQYQDAGQCQRKPEIVHHRSPRSKSQHIKTILSHLLRGYPRHPRHPRSIPPQSPDRLQFPHLQQRHLSRTAGGVHGQSLVVRIRHKATGHLHQAVSGKHFDRRAIDQDPQRVTLEGVTSVSIQKSGSPSANSISNSRCNRSSTSSRMMCSVHRWSPADADGVCRLAVRDAAARRKCRVPRPKSRRRDSITSAVCRACSSSVSLTWEEFVVVPWIAGIGCS